jgi:hypothetical protein
MHVYQQKEVPDHTSESTFQRNSENTCGNGIWQLINRSKLTSHIFMDLFQANKKVG